MVFRDPLDCKRCHGTGRMTVHKTLEVLCNCPVGRQLAACAGIYTQPPREARRG